MAPRDTNRKMGPKMMERDGALFSLLEHFFSDLHRAHKTPEQKAIPPGQLKTQWARFFSACCEETKNRALTKEELHTKYSHEFF